MPLPFGLASMTAPLRSVLVKRPDAAFGAAFDDPAHGFLRPVDLPAAQAEHDAFTALLARLGVEVHALDAALGPDLVYTYDPALITRRGAILLRSGKPTRAGEEEAVGAWLAARGVPILGRIAAPGAVDGGDVFWLDERTVCVGRSLRTNQAGIDALAALLDEAVLSFDLPYGDGPDACLHLLSVISPVAPDLAVVDRRRLPAGLYRLLEARGIGLIDVPDDEIDTLGCNVLAIRPGLAVGVEGNPVTRARLEARGVEVHTFPGAHLCWNGSGGPTCLTRPLRRG